MVDIESIVLVENSWEKAVPLGVDTIGRLFYSRVFELDPTLLDLFNFKKEPDLFNSEIFKTHAAKVVTTIGKAVSMLRDLNSLVPVLKSLGKRHVQYGVKQEHYPTITNALLDILEAGLAEHFTPDVKNAWESVLSVVATTMMEGADGQ